MVTILALGGVPASGKSTILKRFITDLATATVDVWNLKKYKTVEYMQMDSVYILGTYHGTDFDGTDRLSMAVSPDAKAFIDILIASGKDCAVIFEGDRLFTASFIKHLSALPEVKCFPWLIYSSDRVIAERRDERKAAGINQELTFLKGRVTKIQNILSAFPFMYRAQNDTEEDCKQIVENLIEAAMGAI